MQLYDTSRQRKSHARALGAGIQSLKESKELFLLLRAESDTVIADEEQQPPAS
jgi:hypothetical protein